MIARIRLHSILLQICFLKQGAATGLFFVTLQAFVLSSSNENEVRLSLLPFDNPENQALPNLHNYLAPSAELSHELFWIKVTEAWQYIEQCYEERGLQVCMHEYRQTTQGPSRPSLQRAWPSGARVCMGIEQGYKERGLQVYVCVHGYRASLQRAWSAGVCVYRVSLQSA